MANKNRSTKSFLNLKKKKKNLIREKIRFEWLNFLNKSWWIQSRPESFHNYATLISAASIPGLVYHPTTTLNKLLITESLAVRSILLFLFSYQRTFMGLSVRSHATPQRERAWTGNWMRLFVRTHPVERSARKKLSIQMIFNQLLSCIENFFYTTWFTRSGLVFETTIEWLFRDWTHM